MAFDCSSYWSDMFRLPDLSILSPVTGATRGLTAPSTATPPLNPVTQPTGRATPAPSPAPEPAAAPAAETASPTSAAAEEAAEASENEPDCTTGNCPTCEIITGPMLAQVYDQATAAERAIAAKELNLFINRGQLDTELRLAHFLGQTRQETAGAILKTENLNYKVAVLKAKFGYYGENPDKAEQHGRVEDKGKVTQTADQEAIANHAYGGRLENGPIGNGNGWRYRGRGIKQLTGYTNYKGFTAGHTKLWKETKDFKANPDLLATDAKYAVRSGIWFWANHNLGLKADRGGTRAAANAISTVVNKYDGDVGFNNRYNNMRAILNRGTFKNVCFNKSLATRNKEAWLPFGDKEE